MPDPQWIEGARRLLYTHMIMNMPEHTRKSIPVIAIEDKDKELPFGGTQRSYMQGKIMVNISWRKGLSEKPFY